MLVGAARVPSAEGRRNGEPDDPLYRMLTFHTPNTKTSFFMRACWDAQSDGSLALQMLSVPDLVTQGILKFEAIRERQKGGDEPHPSGRTCTCATYCRNPELLKLIVARGGPSKDQDGMGVQTLGNAGSVFVQADANRAQRPQIGRP